ncbi:MAG TPA: ATP-binding protein [Candidatus Sulfopaludibacter sp.]|jgi:serine/threonine-protein kinase RsbW|nr:ATP-binding protein [Candidatus Sulfopaludibacter sp.]
MMPPIERTFTLQVPSSTENLAMIRDFVTSVGEQAGMTAPKVAQLELAVDEACANVIEHAYGKDMTKEVSVRATVDDDAVEIVVTDTGQGFDPSAVEQKDLDKLISDRKSGGLGMRLMNQLMDEVHYEMIPGKKNELRMVKKLKR